MTEVPSPLARLPDHKLLLGLFLPMQQGAWSPSKAPRSTSWTFDYIARCTTTAEALGFDLVFGLAQWLGKGGYGGEMRFRTKVDKILVEHDRVTGVRLRDGSTISAPVVVSNIAPDLTLTDLVGAEYLPADLIARLSGRDHRAAFIQMHFALDGLPEFAPQL